jgi:hypothetical protein
LWGATDLDFTIILSIINIGDVFIGESSKIEEFVFDLVKVHEVIVPL